MNTPMTPDEPLLCGYCGKPIIRRRRGAYRTTRFHSKKAGDPTACSDKARQRVRRADPEYRAREYARSNANRRRQTAEGGEAAERKNAAGRKKYHDQMSDSAWRQKEQERNRQRMAKVRSETGLRLAQRLVGRPGIPRIKDAEMLADYAIEQDATGGCDWPLPHQCTAGQTDSGGKSLMHWEHDHAKASEVCGHNEFAYCVNCIRARVCHMANKAERAHLQAKTDGAIPPPAVAKYWDTWWMTDRYVPTDHQWWEAPDE